MVEVPDKEDDTAFQLHQAKQAKPANTPKLLTPSKETRFKWLKLFETEWTWRAIRDTKDESAARSVLLNWIHKTRAEEVVDNLLDGLRRAERTNALEWLDELHKPKRYLIRSTTTSKRDLKIPLQLELLDSQRTLSATALLDSGCTGSSIHSEYVKTHNIPVHKAASPIPIYNADGS